MHPGERPYLATPDRGHLYVMDFVRAGMQDATPRFARWNNIDNGGDRGRMGGIMSAGVLLRDGSMHPDARLISAAPEMLEALRVARVAVKTNRDSLHEGVVNQSTGEIDDASDAVLVAELDRTLERIGAAISKATGGAPC